MELQAMTGQIVSLSRIVEAHQVVATTLEALAFLGRLVAAVESPPPSKV